MGKLFIVATPIGNLGDITLRALETLKNANLVLAEDTRRTKILLQHYKITTPLQSFHEHSDEAKVRGIISYINKGNDIALVSDAGTPNLSDPGGKLAELAIAENIIVVPIPGASSLTALISVAPFSMSEFSFKGYFPKKKGRQTMLKEIQGTDHPVIFLESSHRITKTLEMLQGSLTGFNILIGRELTKIYEQVVFCRLDNLNIEEIPPKGEFVIALAKIKE